MAYREYVCNNKIARCNNNGYRNIHDNYIPEDPAIGKSQMAMARIDLTIGHDNFIDWFENSFELNGKTINDFSWNEILKIAEQKLSELKGQMND